MFVLSSVDTKFYIERLGNRWAFYLIFFLHHISIVGAASGSHTESKTHVLYSSEGIEFQTICDQRDAFLAFHYKPIKQRKGTQNGGRAMSRRIFSFVFVSLLLLAFIDEVVGSSIKLLGRQKMERV